MNPTWYSCDSHWRILFRLQLVLDLKLRPAHIALRLRLRVSETRHQRHTVTSSTQWSSSVNFVLYCDYTAPSIATVRVLHGHSGGPDSRVSGCFGSAEVQLIATKFNLSCLSVKRTYQRMAEVSGRGNNYVLCRKRQNNVCRPRCRRYKMWQKQ